MNILINILKFITLLLIQQLYLLHAIEYEASGILDVKYDNEYGGKYSTRFNIYVKDNKWYFNFYYNNPKIASGTIESGYDGKYIYSIADMLAASKINYYCGSVRNSPYYQEGIYSGGEMLWATFCSRDYFSSLKSCDIYPVLKFSAAYYSDENSANIVYLPDSNFTLSSFNYGLHFFKYAEPNNYVNYEVLEYTNLNNNLIPIKSRAYHYFRYILNRKEMFLTDAVYIVQVDKIIPECSLDDFKPKIKREIDIGDFRYEGKPGMPEEPIFYRATNWLSDNELFEHPSFKSAHKRTKELEKGIKKIEQQERIGRVLFFSLSSLTLIPMGLIIIKYKLKK